MACIHSFEQTGQPIQHASPIGTGSLCHAWQSAICLQIVPGVDKKKTSAENVSLVEVGPRCCMNPIKVFSGSFGGPVLYDNPAYVSPNKVSMIWAGTILEWQCSPAEFDD